MPKSKEFLSSDSESSGNDEPKAKKKKPEKKPEKEEKRAAASPERGSGGEYMFELSGRKYATVSEFKGKVYVGVREYYEKDGKLLPGKKGISLNGDQWRRLKGLMPDLDECMKKF